MHGHLRDHQLTDLHDQQQHGEQQWEREHERQALDGTGFATVNSRSLDQSHFARDACKSANKKQKLPAKRKAQGKHASRIARA